MKRLKPLLLTFTFILISYSSQAQFLKKLLKKAENKIEREAEKRTEKRINKKIDGAFDTTEEGLDGASFPSKKALKIALPTKYSFNWNYTLKTTLKKEAISMLYLLNSNPAKTYFGMEIQTDKKNQKKSTTIIDMGRKAFITLIEIDGQKVRNTMVIPEVNNEEDYKMTKIGTKTILNYNCQGFKMTKPDGVLTLYLAKDAPVSFIRDFKNSRKNMSSAMFKKLFKDFGNGSILMEATFISTKSKKKNWKTICTSLTKVATTININKYKSISEFKK